MNYELAKQLKDAGFPQTYKSESFFIHHETGERPINPTLSELIQACGISYQEPSSIKDAKFGYFFLEYHQVSNEWITGYQTYSENGYRVYCYLSYAGAPAFGSGKTPEEAVAHLYLVLNNHD